MSAIIFWIDLSSTDAKRLKYRQYLSKAMASAEVEKQSPLSLEVKIVDFEDRPLCPSCNNPMIICSHSTPSPVIGFEGTYATKYIEYTCGDRACPHCKKKKYRAPNPWRVDRHKYDLEIETEVAHHHFHEKKTYQEIQDTLKKQWGIEISQKTIGNIILRYETACKLESEGQISGESQKNGGVFIGIDTMAPVKGEEKHIAAIDHYSGRTLVVEPVSSENTDVHIAFQEKLKRFTENHKIQVLGFMSDDHVAQRTAIRSVWGPTMKHCRCRFHFEKRILEGPFNLNRKLKTKAIARIRKIWYVKQYREGKLQAIANSKVWAYLEEVIEDLITLQTWKTKRNDTTFESLLFYERLADLYQVLRQLENQLSLLPNKAYPSEQKRLELLLSELEAILASRKQDYEDLLRIKRYHEQMKIILDAHAESSRVGLDKLMAFAKELEALVNVGKITCDEEKDYIEKLCAFVFDRGASLFHYRAIKNANNTNNPQETKFKTIKYGIRRTQGIVSGSQYLQNHANYLLFVDPDASREEIHRILMQADYKAIAQILKEDRTVRKRPLLKIKDNTKWAFRKKAYGAKLLEIK